MPWPPRPWAPAVHRRLGARARPRERSIRAGRNPARRDRGHEPERRRGVLAARQPRVPRGLQGRRRRLQPGAARREDHAVQPRRRPHPGPPADERSHHAGALRRRDRRLQLGHRPPHAFIHAADRSARAQRRRAACDRAGRSGVFDARAGCPSARRGSSGRASAGPGASAGRRASRAASAVGGSRLRRRPRPAPHALRTAPAAVPGARRLGRRRDPSRCMRATRSRPSRVAQKEAGRLARPDAGLAVPQQPAGFRRREHEPDEVRRHAGRALGRGGEAVVDRKKRARSSRRRAPTSRPIASVSPVACPP